MRLPRIDARTVAHRPRGKGAATLAASGGRSRCIRVGIAECVSCELYRLNDAVRGIAVRGIAVRPSCNGVASGVLSRHYLVAGLPPPARVGPHPHAKTGLRPVAADYDPL